MEKIGEGKYVEFVYDLYKINADGTEELIHQVDETEPEAIVYGVTRGVVGPLEKDLNNKAAGDTFDVIAAAEEAFGERSDEYIVVLDKNIFEVDGKFDDEMVKKGNDIPMMTADGMRISGKVLEVSPTQVKMDFNHPLAGSAVRFKGKVKNVRPANKEELAFATSGGCGGCGGDGDCNCQSNEGGCGGCGCQ